MLHHVPSAPPRRASRAVPRIASAAVLTAVAVVVVLRSGADGGPAPRPAASAALVARPTAVTASAPAAAASPAPAASPAATSSSRASTAAARSENRDPRAAARLLLAEHGWGGGQFSCLDALWTKESGWKHTARNPSSGAYGIPQALPASKLAGAGADWRTNPVTQIRWGLQYIEESYGSPCAAWAHSRATDWY